MSTSGTTSPKTGSRSGYLVINPLSIPRKAAVVLPDAALDLRPEGPLKVAQFTDEGVYAVVDLPAFGFAWVPKEADQTRLPAVTAGLSARDRRLRNESIEIEVDATTGGLRSVAAMGEESPRLGQQLVMTGLFDARGQAIDLADAFRKVRGGVRWPRARAGDLERQPDRSASRRSTGLVRSTLPAVGGPADPRDRSHAERSQSRLGSSGRRRLDPWNVYLACRWAWPDSNSMVRRSVLLGPEITESERPETPDFFDISTRKHRTALLFGGLCHHRKHGDRMLDTLLIAGLEETAVFHAGRRTRSGATLPRRPGMDHAGRGGFDRGRPSRRLEPAAGWRRLTIKAWSSRTWNSPRTTNDDRGWGLDLPPARDDRAGGTSSTAAVS